MEKDRLDKLVAGRFGLSRRAAQDAVRNGRVDIGGARADEPGALVEPGVEISYHPNRPKARRVVGSKLEVLHEDGDLIVVNKPAGLLTIRTALGEDNTLLDRVTAYLRVRHGRAPEVGVVHRLDKDTSGALVFAKHRAALRELQALFRAHAIERQYLAVVEGSILAARGTINERIVIGGEGVRARVSRHSDEGVDAVTHFRVIDRFGSVATLLVCWLETGRTNQIRIHLASHGHAVIGDKVFRSRGGTRCKASFKRQALHAQTLGFVHPFSGEPISVEAAPPDDLARWIDSLRLRYGIRGAGG